MKKNIIFFTFIFLFPIFVLSVLYLALNLFFLAPNIIDATNLRIFAAPEYVLNRFYTERDLAEDQLTDALILAGPKMVPLLELEISKREIPRRRYAISALGILGDNDSIPILEHILQDKSEKEEFRGDALLAIAKIDLSYAKTIAPNYLNDMSFVSTCANKVLTGDPVWLEKRSYWDALYHRHY